MLPEATQARRLVQNKSDDDTNPAIACDDIRFRKCHHGHDNEIPDNVWHVETDVFKKSLAYDGDHEDPCRQVITSTGQDEILAGTSRKMIIAACDEQSEKGMHDSEDNRDPEQGGQEVDNEEKPRRKHHLASLYIARHNDGAWYHLRMTPELREEYRKLATRDEKIAFIAANGLPGKRLEKESTGEFPEVD